jgi:hypothetical protein
MELKQVAPKEVPDRLLEIARYHTRISEVALYTFDRMLLKRITFLGAAHRFPLELDPKRHALIQAAIESGKIATVEDLVCSSKDHLIAAPLTDSKNKVSAILLVGALPMDCSTQRLTDSLRLICHYGGLVLDRSFALKSYRSSVGPRTVADLDELNEKLIQLTEAFEKHRIPSTAVTLRLPWVSKQYQQEFEQALLPILRNSDFIARPELEEPSLSILLPLTDLEGAERLIERANQVWQDSEHPIEARAALIEDRHQLSALTEELLLTRSTNKASRRPKSPSRL